MTRSKWFGGFVLAAALAAGCGERDRQPLASAPVVAAGHAARPPVGASIYPLKLALRDQDDRPTSLDAGRGHPVIATMFYGSCPAACPLLISRVRELESELPAEARAETRVLLVSFDPEHDTPEVLRGIAARHGADPSRWTLASGPDEDVRSLAAALAISFRKLPGGAFAHDSSIVALSKEGRILARADGTADLAPLVAALSREAATAD